jgi:hypothetical protein
MEVRMAHQAVVTFTARGSDRIIQEGGSQSWKLNTERMKDIEFLVCTQNVHNGPWGGMDHPHRSAFLVGRVAGVVPSTDTPGRWLIAISEFARVNIPEVWDKSRFPVRYTTLEDLGIDPATLNFEPLPPRPGSPTTEDEEADHEEIPPPGIVSEAVAGGEKVQPSGVVRSVADAKRVLSQVLGVPQTSIDITVRY